MEKKQEWDEGHVSEHWCLRFALTMMTHRGWRVVVRTAPIGLTSKFRFRDLNDAPRGKQLVSGQEGLGPGSWNAKQNPCSFHGSTWAVRAPTAD